jgi:hypothetical protein
MNNIDGKEYPNMTTANTAPGMGQGDARLQLAGQVLSGWSDPHHEECMQYTDCNSYAERMSRFALEVADTILIATQPAAEGAGDEAERTAHDKWYHEYYQRGYISGESLTAWKASAQAERRRCAKMVETCFYMHLEFSELAKCLRRDGHPDTSDAIMKLAALLQSEFGEDKS